MSQISLELHHQISQFLYREAKLLDDWKFRDWLDTLSEDISYTLRTTHMVSNVIVEPTEVEGEYDVYVTYLLYRTQKEKDVVIYCGKRHDKIRKVEGGLGFQIFNRKITLDQVTYNSHNLSVFF